MVKIKPTQFFNKYYHQLQSGMGIKVFSGGDIQSGHGVFSTNDGNYYTSFQNKAHDGAISSKFKKRKNVKKLNIRGGGKIKKSLINRRRNKKRSQSKFKRNKDDIFY